MPIIAAAPGGRCAAPAAAAALKTRRQRVATRARTDLQRSCTTLTQGTVRQKLIGSVRLDDGTGLVDCVVGGGGAAPGLELDSISPGAYCLAVGKLLSRQQDGCLHFHVKAHKVGHKKGSWVLGGSARRRLRLAHPCPPLQPLPARRSRRPCSLSI